MSQEITFCNQTISNANQRIEKKKLNYTQKLDRNESEEIISSLEKNDGLNRKHLQTKKYKEI